eukprot:TRINITY_DN59869_c0_g1_i1.p1 TRINITY_DN59869_c0_g1~~TRINITY_DN59869_c0_g1_i1.p1  ORF type:complete len:385 (+),score=101.56 TRINITY_DN59869_c0_g1_i1:125-1279(+)
MEGTEMREVEEQVMEEEEGFEAQEEFRVEREPTGMSVEHEITAILQAKDPGTLTPNELEQIKSHPTNPELAASALRLLNAWNAEKALTVRKTEAQGKLNEGISNLAGIENAITAMKHAATAKLEQSKTSKALEDQILILDQEMEGLLARREAASSEIRLLDSELQQHAAALQRLKKERTMAEEQLRRSELGIRESVFVRERLVNEIERVTSEIGKEQEWYQKIEIELTAGHTHCHDTHCPDTNAPPSPPPPETSRRLAEIRRPMTAGAVVRRSGELKSVRARPGSAARPTKPQPPPRAPANHTSRGSRTGFRDKTPPARSGLLSTTMTRNNLEACQGQLKGMERVRKAGKPNAKAKLEKRLAGIADELLGWVCLLYTSPSPRDS